jgi:AcrR family transcriptional regulator
MITTSRKQHILFSAQKLFREKGYAATSMRDLAKEVGVEAPSLYNHFSSKHELLKEICFDIAEQFYASFHQAVSHKLSYTEKLSAAITSHVQVIFNNIEASTVFFEEWMFLEGNDLAKFKKLRSGYQQKFRELIEKGIETGEIKNMDVRVATFAILSSLNATHELYKHDKNADPIQIAATIADLLINGISLKNKYYHSIKK